MFRRPHTLYIDPSRSTCGGCGQGANPKELCHDTVFEYSPDSGRPGCGQRYVFVSSNYTDFEGLHARVRAMRPDLEPDFPWG